MWRMKFWWLVHRAPFPRWRTSSEEKGVPEALPPPDALTDVNLFSPLGRKDSLVQKTKLGGCLEVSHSRSPQCTLQAWVANSGLQLPRSHTDHHHRWCHCHSASDWQRQNKRILVPLAPLLWPRVSVLGGGMKQLQWKLPFPLLWLYSISSTSSQD